MQRHHIQREIIHKLVRAETALYSQLKPEHVDGNTFTYHLKQLQAEKIIRKLADGSYTLTSSGKIVGTTSDLPLREATKQAHAVLLLGLYDSEKAAWLLRKRLAQPMYGNIGFVHTEPQHNELVSDTAHRVFSELTGFDASFAPAGSGYIRLYENGELESFIHFTLLTATSYTGTLLQQTRSGENVWVSNKDLSKVPLIPSIPDLLAALAGSDTNFFVDLSYDTKH